MPTIDRRPSASTTSTALSAEKLSVNRRPKIGGPGVSEAVRDPSKWSALCYERKLPLWTEGSPGVAPAAMLPRPMTGRAAPRQWIPAKRARSGADAGRGPVTTQPRAVPSAERTSGSALCRDHGAAAATAKAAASKQEADEATRPRAGGPAAASTSRAPQARVVERAPTVFQDRGYAAMQAQGDRALCSKAEKARGADGAEGPRRPHTIPGAIGRPEPRSSIAMRAPADRGQMGGSSAKRLPWRSIVPERAAPRGAHPRASSLSTSDPRWISTVGIAEERAAPRSEVAAPNVRLLSSRKSIGSSAKRAPWRSRSATSAPPREWSRSASSAPPCGSSRSIARLPVVHRRPAPPVSVRPLAPVVEVE